MVFLPACLASMAASAAIFDILSSITVENSSRASWETLFAPAFLRILSKGAKGIVIMHHLTNCYNSILKIAITKGELGFIKNLNITND